MPLKKKIARRPRRKLISRRKQKIGRMPKQTTGAFASRTEQFSLAVTAGVVYDFTFNLNDMPVIAALAQFYQYYRITTVELRFKPNYDTFQAQQANLVPYLNFQYDKAGVLQGTMNAANFEQLGTKAIRLDDKTIVRKWKPSVLTTNTAPGFGTTSQFKVSPWMPTHIPGTNQVNDEDHYGACWYISKMSPGDVLGYDVDVVVNVQFRKPYITPSSNTTGGNPPRMIQNNESGATGEIVINPLPSV